MMSNSPQKVASYYRGIFSIWAEGGCYKGSWEYSQKPSQCQQTLSGDGLELKGLVFRGVGVERLRGIRVWGVGPEGLWLKGSGGEGLRV